MRSCENETKALITKSVTDIIKSDVQLPDITENDADKFYRIGPMDNDSKQKTSS